MVSVCIEKIDFVLGFVRVLMIDFFFCIVKIFYCSMFFDRYFLCIEKIFFVYYCVEYFDKFVKYI